MVLFNYLEFKVRTITLISPSGDLQYDDANIWPHINANLLGVITAYSEYPYPAQAFIETILVGSIPCSAK